jgi:hypothetical protein
MSLFDYLVPQRLPDLEQARHRVNALRRGEPISEADGFRLPPSTLEDWMAAGLDAVTPMVPLGIIRAVRPPMRDVPAYRAHRVYPDDPRFFGNIYPAMVGKEKKSMREALPRGEWLKSEFIPFGMKPRKGWHAGELPRAKQFDLKRPELKGMMPEHMVWSDVSMGADLDLSNYLTPDVPTTVFHRQQVPFEDPKALPEGGMYLYLNRANDPPWIVSDYARHNRLLTDEEVADILRSAGLPPPPERFGGPITEEKLKRWGLEEWL